MKEKELYFGGARGGGGNDAMRAAEKLKHQITIDIEIGEFVVPTEPLKFRDIKFENFVAVLEDGKVVICGQLNHLGGRCDCCLEWSKVFRYAEIKLTPDTIKITEKVTHRHMATGNWSSRETREGGDCE